MTGQRLVAEMVHGYGIDHVFLVPTILTPALAAMGEFGTTRVTAHSEKAAAYMADGYARATRRPGVCMAQTVGAANLASGLKDAWLAGSPVLAISGGTSPDTAYRHAYQELTEDFTMFTSVTKFNARVTRVDRLPDLFRQAIRAATTGAPGPVHLELAGEQGSVANEEIDLDLIAERRFAHAPAFRAPAESADIDAALAALAQAQRPVLMAGGGVATSSGQAEFLRFAELHGIPFVTSLNGKSGFPDAHVLNVGVVGSYSRSCANMLVAEADLVFFIGSHAGGQATAGWKIPRPGTTVIQLDIDPLELGRNYPNIVSLLGDARTVLAQLNEASRTSATADRIEGWRNHASELRSAWWAEMEDNSASDAVPMRPERVCRELSEALPDDAVVVVDTGHSGMWTGQFLQLRGPRQTYLRAAGSLGWSFPASLGVKCAVPNRPVICFTGDGGFYYHAMELETAARYHINSVVLVNNNFSLNQDERPFTAAYGGRQEEGFEMWQFSRETDFAKLAASLGCVGIVVEKADDLKPALERALSLDKPVVLDVRTDITAMAPRAWTSTKEAPLRPGTTY